MPDILVMIKKLRHIVFPLLLLFGVTQMHAQTFGAYVKAGDKAMEEKEYFSAAKHYEEALVIQDQKTAVRFKYAEACRLLFAFEKAEEAYRIVAKTPGAIDQFPLVYFWLGQVNRQLGHHETAKRHYDRYLKNNKSSTGYYFEKATQEIISCDFAIENTKKPTEAIVTWLDKIINTPYSDFGANLMGDSLYFSSLRFKSKEKEKDKEIKLSRILISVNGEKARMVSGNINDSNAHTANSTFSRDRARCYFTRCMGENNEDIICEIFVRKRNNEGWSKPEKLPQQINVPGFTTTHPGIGTDPETGKELLFFSTNRPGGKGGMDIWYSTMSESGAYSNPLNVGDVINTIGDEISPFYRTEDHTLFFSSDWHPGFGGLDIFSSGNSTDGYAPPFNVGMPINSYNNDVYYVINRDGLSGFFSSNRKGSLSLSEDYNCCYDIYSVELPPKPELVVEPPPSDTTPLVLIPDPKVPEIVEIPTVTPPDPVPGLEKMLPLTLYFHNDEPDSNTVRNTTPLSYNETFDFYYSLKSKYLDEYSRGNAELQYEMDKFFDFEVKAGFDKLETFTETLLQALNLGLSMDVGIRGFTSPRAPTQYNVHLANRRISSLKNYFSKFGDGVLLPYLENGQLNLTETPLGESTSPAGISDAYNDPRNSIYSPGASRERRVEVTSISFKD